MIDSIPVKYKWLFTSLFFLLIAFLLFYHLDVRSIFPWDESRLAMNTASMFKNGNYLFTQYQAVPDFWNTKPHLLILLQTLASKLFGLTEGSIRLPSAIAAYLSCVLIFYWMRRERYTALFASLATLAFLCTKFLSSHGARAGDYESLLILCQLSYCYAFFQYMKSHHLSYLWLGIMGLTLAVLTKGIAGILFIPGVVIFAYFNKKMPLFLKNKFFYLGTVFFILTIMGYYCLHEKLTPGYLKSVYFNEVGGRYFNVNEGHAGNMWFYIRALRLRYFYFLPFLLIGLVYLLFHIKILYRNIFLQYVLILALTFFIIISLSQTKIVWYNFPSYPFLGITVAILSNEISKNLIGIRLSLWLKTIMFWMLIAYIAAFTAVLASIREKHNIRFFIKNNLKYFIPHDYSLVVNDLNKDNPSLDFQIEKYSLNKKYHIHKILLKDLREGDWVIIENAQLPTMKFNTETLYYSANENYGIYKLKDKK